jgi:hypothetical protein
LIASDAARRRGDESPKAFPSRRSLLVLVLPCAALRLGVASCVNFGDLTSPDASVPSDAAGPDVAGDAAPVDARGETAIVDAAAEAVAADAGSFCAQNPNHTYCFDFDFIGTPAVGWSTMPFLSPGGSVTLNMSTFVSPPASMLSTATNGLVGGGTYAVLNLNLMGSPTSVEVAMDVSTTGNPPISTAWLKVGYSSASAPQDSYSASIGAGPSGVAAQLQFPTVMDGGFGFGSQTYPVSALMPDDAGWTRIDFLIQFAPDWSLTVSFGNEVEIMQEVLGSTSLPEAGAGVSLGVIAVGNGGPVHVNYDNVTIDVH